MSAMPKSVKKEAIDRGRRLYQTMKDSGSEFTISEFRTQLAQECLDLAVGAFDGFIDAVVDRVDRDSLKDDGEQSSQTRLFDLDGVYKLGDTRRIAMRYASIEHAKAALAIDDTNRERVDRANDRKHEEMDRLSPYWRADMTKQDAVAAYLEDNPMQGKAG